MAVGDDHRARRSEAVERVPVLSRRPRPREEVVLARDRDGAAHDWPEVTALGAEPEKPPVLEEAPPPDVVLESDEPDPAPAVIDPERAVDAEELCD
jgi:hypothetical protein